MTREEAIDELFWIREDENDLKGKEALEMAIKALEAPPNDNWEGYSKRLWKSAYERGKADAEQRWIPVSERLPEDFGTYLITLENGDVCQCDFNPDFWDEDNNREGAFTYYHQYFDQATLGMIDEEEETVDAIAWMPFEPYRAESEEV